MIFYFNLLKVFQFLFYFILLMVFNQDEDKNLGPHLTTVSPTSKIKKRRGFTNLRQRRPGTPMDVNRWIDRRETHGIVDARCQMPDGDLIFSNE